MGHNAQINSAAVAFLKLNRVVIQLFYRMDGRSRFQNPDFIVARKCEVKAEVLFHKNKLAPGFSLCRYQGTSLIVPK